MEISKKVSAVTSFIAMDIMNRAKEMEARGEHIIHMELSEPDFDAPGKIIDETINGLKNKDTHYTHSLGKIALRDSIANYYQKHMTLMSIPTRSSSPRILLRQW